MPARRCSPIRDSGSCKLRSKPESRWFRSPARRRCWRRSWRPGSRRSATLDEVVSSPHTAVLYEAPGRVADSLLELASRAGDRAAVVARELTKHFEELRRGTLASLGAYYNETPPRGEVVIVIAGAPP